MPTRFFRFLSVLGVTLASVAFADAPSPPAAPWLVVVHPSNAVTSVEREFLAEAFLKKTTRWRDDRVIQPVDARYASPVRKRFSDDVLRRSVTAVRSYWQQVVFSGRGVPPPELDSDAAILDYVRKHAGAVGYVSGATEPVGVKVVQVR